MSSITQRALPPPERGARRDGDLAGEQSLVCANLLSGVLKLGASISDGREQIETVSRQLAKLKAAGIVALPGVRAVTIRDRAALQARAARWEAIGQQVPRRWR